MQTKTTKTTQKETQTTQNPQTQHTQQTQKKVITIGGRGRSPSKSKEKDKITIELRKLIESYVFEIPDTTTCRPIQAYISSYSSSRVQGLITLLCSSVGGYNVLTNVAFVAKKRQDENEYEIEKTWIKNAMRLFVTMEPKEEDIKIVFADEFR